MEMWTIDMRQREYQILHTPDPAAWTLQPGVSLSPLLHRTLEIYKCHNKETNNTNNDTKHFALFLVEEITLIMMRKRII